MSPPCFVVVGDAGQGKTSLINRLFDKFKGTEGDSGFHVTDKLEPKQCTLQGKEEKYMVYDCVGTGKSKKNMPDLAKHNSGVILVVGGGRPLSTLEDYKNHPALAKCKDAIKLVRGFYGPPKSRDDRDSIGINEVTSDMVIEWTKEFPSLPNTSASLPNRSAPYSGDRSSSGGNCQKNVPVSLLDVSIHKMKNPERKKSNVVEYIKRLPELSIVKSRDEHKERGDWILKGLKLKGKVPPASIENKQLSKFAKSESMSGIWKALKVEAEASDETVGNYMEMFFAWAAAKKGKGNSKERTCGKTVLTLFIDWCDKEGS